MEKDKKCGACKFNRWDYRGETFYCTNRESDYYGCETFYDDACAEYEEKESKL